MNKLKLNRENYHSNKANKRYMSVSQFKDFAPAWGGCEAMALAKVKGEYEQPFKEAFMEGHFVHSWNEGKLEEFKANNPDLYSSRGATAGQLKSNYKHCNVMIDVLEKDPMVMKVLSGQKEVVLTGELFGIEWKIMLDSYNPDIKVFADLKALKDIDGKFWNNEAQMYENFLEAYGYLTQMAVYAEIERISQGREPEDWCIPHMVVVTKQEPPDHEIMYFDYYMIHSELLKVQQNIDRVIQVKNEIVKPIRCEKCEYCRSTKKITKIKHYMEFDLYD
ncbi:MAG TPA: PD-(D/E)XK nuclease-like domain-containing protein [Clostridia bacterium]|nr:PD-(D/E)XK nuclease-like domain-containing protein [Clostridia bacterium]